MTLMKKLFSSLYVVLFCAMLSLSAQEATSFQDVYLWPDGMPNSNGAEEKTIGEKEKRVAKPFMRIFLPDAQKATGRVVLALPGGGYSHLTWGHEGYDWAPFFNERGIAFVVLNYRMPYGNTEVPASDVYEAIRYLRDHATALKINPNDLGIMGSSAGGHLASTVATHAVESLRPNFQILFYPVITMDTTFTHIGSHNNLLGVHPSEGLERKYSNEKQVDSMTPPAILLCSHDDRAVPTRNSVEYYLALQRNGVSASLHIYPTGGHGWGSRPKFKFHEAMIRDLSDWLDQLKVKTEK